MKVIDLFIAKFALWWVKRALWLAKRGSPAQAMQLEIQKETLEAIIPRIEASK